MLSALELSSRYLPRNKCLDWPDKHFCICYAAIYHLTRKRICQVLTNKSMLKDGQSVGLERKVSLT